MIIKDKLIEPFQIKVTDVSFNVIETGINEKGKDTITTHGYYSDMKNALTKIVKMKVKYDVETMDLNSYFNRLEELSNKLKTLK